MCPGESTSPAASALSRGVEMRKNLMSLLTLIEKLIPLRKGKTQKGTQPPDATYPLW